MSVLSPALLGAVGLVLLAAAFGHLRDPGALRGGLRAHGVLPDGTHRLVSVLLGPLEAVLGAAALVAAVTGPSLIAALAVSMPIAGLFLVLTGYLVQVLRVTAGRAVPCACGLGDTPVGRPAVVRGGILTVMAFVGGATAAGWSASGVPAEEVVVALAAALVLGLATALLPAARVVPDAALRAAATGGNTHHGGHR